MTSPPPPTPYLLYFYSNSYSRICDIFYVVESRRVGFTLHRFDEKTDTLNVRKVKEMVTVDSGSVEWKTTEVKSDFCGVNTTLKVHKVS